MTERLYYHDSYLTSFEAEVSRLSADGLEVELDRTAFYPTSGGQPHDLGLLAGIKVVDVFEVDSEIVHRLASPLAAGLKRVEGQVDEPRRFDHMRQHTGQHLLSAVMDEEFGLKTVSFHLGADYATVDIEPATASVETLLRIEQRANDRLLSNLAVTVSFEDSRAAQGLRKPPDRDGILRIVSIAGLDRSACGGTHVSHTSEVGCIVLGKTEKVRKALRLEFYCAHRAIRYLKTRLVEAETQSASLRERLSESDKRTRKLSGELAEIAGRRKYSEISPDAQGRRVWVEEFESLSDDAKTMMNAFLAEPNSLALLSARSGSTILIAAHPGLSLDCGALLKTVVTQLGGKGGGSSRSAQGSVSDPTQLSNAVALLLNQAVR